jgi:enoyl-CoA hydratase/carnithine racemase
MTDEPAAGSAVRIVRIGRPERRNAIDSETAQRLHDELVAFDEDAGAKVAILTGDESAFCAGADLRDLPRLRDSGPLGPTRLQLSKPLLGAIEGWCVAGGVELAALCDLRVAGDTARFGCLERRWGVPLIDGGTVRLPRIMGLGRALDLILTGREIDAREAEHLGFVNRVVPAGQALATTIEVAEGIAASPWTAVLHDRASAYEGLDLPIADALANEDVHGRAVIFDPGFLGGVDRFRQHQDDRRDRGER